MDYDGTLTTEPRPRQEVLEALTRLRECGRVVVLVTGRIFDELRADFPDVRDYFDAMVCENGAVFVGKAGLVSLAIPVPDALETALSAGGIPIRRGKVLLATDSIHGGKILEEITRLELDCQILHNRGALMVLPAGVSKGTGLFHALGELGISYHNCIGIGDAENDHALLDACEVGVVPENAIDSLKAHADIVLSLPNGHGVLSFLQGAANTLLATEPSRWQIGIGFTREGLPVSLPASRINVLITGPSGSGKSYIAGVFVEQLIKLDYTVCVLDLEGDHVGLGMLRGVVVVGGDQPVPTCQEIAKLIRHRFGSVVVDLSKQTDQFKADYARETLALLSKLREQSGLPHWIVVEEAHLPFTTAYNPPFLLSQLGLCLVTYHPETIAFDIGSARDVKILLRSEGTANLRRGQSSASQDFIPIPTFNDACASSAQVFSITPAETPTLFPTGRERSGWSGLW